MAYDKAVDSTALDNGLTIVADAIRAKGGTAAPLEFPRGMADAVAAISGGGGTKGLYMAEITPSEDLDEMVIRHDLGTNAPMLALCFVKTLAGKVPDFNGCVFKAWVKTEIPVRVTSSNNNSAFSAASTWNAKFGNANTGTIASGAYLDEAADRNTFKFHRGGSSAARFISGVTYTVIIASAELGGE